MLLCALFAASHPLPTARRCFERGCRHRRPHQSSEAPDVTGRAQRRPRPASDAQLLPRPLVQTALIDAMHRRVNLFRLNVAAACSKFCRRGGSQRRAHAERRKHFSSSRGGRYLCSVYVPCTEEPTKSRQWFRVPAVRHTNPRSNPEWRPPGTHTKTNGCVERSTYTVTNVDDQCGAPLAPRFRGDRTPCAATVGHESWQRLNQRS